MKSEYSPDGIKTMFKYHFNPIGTKTLAALYPRLGEKALVFQEAQYFVNANIFLSGARIGTVVVPPYTSRHTFGVDFSSIDEMIISDGLTVWPERLLYMTYGIKKPVIFPETLTQIYGTITNQGGATPTIVIKAKQPPVFMNLGKDGNLANPFYYANAKIYVPNASVEAYKESDGWRLIADYIFPLSEYSL